MTSSQSDNLQKYGVPLFNAAWAPLSATRSTDSADITDSGEDTLSKTSPEYLLLAGGGGEGNSGIPNALLLTKFDRSDNSVSSEPVVRHGTAADVPYRMAVHPQGDGFICSFPNNCRWFEWEKRENGGLGLKLSEKVLNQLEDVGQQLAIAFSLDGSLLAVGGEDGKLRVFRWPSMESLLDDGEAYTVIKDLHFSIDGKYLVSLGSGGPCRVWDVTTSTVVASLPKENDEIFRFCRFSQSSDKDQVLYTVAMQAKGVSIISWNTSSWKRIASKKIVRDSVTAFDASLDGKILAIGTNEGDIFFIDSASIRVHTTLKKAHLGLVTALRFSHDSRALASASMDSSVRVTLVPDKRPNGFNYGILVLIILLAIAIYFLRTQGLIPESLPFH